MAKLCDLLCGLCASVVNAAPNQAYTSSFDLLDIRTKILFNESKANVRLNNSQGNIL